MSEVDSTISRTLVDTLNSELNKLREENERLKQEKENIRARLKFTLPHGDDDHIDWVKKAIDACIDNRVGPNPYGSGKTEAKLRKAIQALEQCAQKPEFENKSAGEQLGIRAGIAMIALREIKGE